MIPQTQTVTILEDFDQGKRLADQALAKLKLQDTINRGFLKPIQITLNSHDVKIHSHNNNKLNYEHFIIQEQQQQNLVTSLPSGLKLIIKKSITDNKFVLSQIKGITHGITYDQLKQNNQDNLLSLMKIPQGLQIAICICMYSENKTMLKNTLIGVAQNIGNIVGRGVDPDRIGVFVIMDGIQKVDSSVVDYFQQLQRANNINLGQNVPPPLTIQQMIQRSRTMSQRQINEQQLKNTNNFLFTITQLQQLNRRRFCQVKADYQQFKKLIDHIEKLKKQKPLIQDLPNKIRPFLIDQAKQYKRIKHGLSQEQIKQLDQSKLVQQFSLNVRKAKPIIFKALQQCQRFCRQHVQSRDNLAYLVGYRCRNMFHPDQQDNVSQGINQLNATKHNLIPEFSQRQDQRYEQKIQVHMNLFLCVKYKNSGKLSSHNWFINGFCKQLKPKYTILLDVGLKPQGKALYKMYNHMKQNQYVGGVCGYMSLKIQQLEEHEEQKVQQQVDFLSRIALNFANIQRTQQVQYHFAHLMDKGFQSAFGFIHVLPGAFSAYNMQAIMDYQATQDDVLLKSYFKSIQDKLKQNKIVKNDLTFFKVIFKVLLPDIVFKLFFNQNPDSQQQMLYNQNINLAQDRILCMGIYKKGFKISFLPDAYAEVDPIKTVHGLLGQRKRWINGSFFAFQKVRRQLSYHQRKKGYDLCLNIQILYLTILNTLAYFAPAMILFTIHIAMDAFRIDILSILFSSVIGDANTSNFLLTFVYTMDFVYILLVLSIVYFSLHLTNNNKKFVPYIYAISTMLGFFGVAIFIVLTVDIIRGLTNHTSFLLQNKELANSISGGIQIIDSMRWILIVSTLIYIVPIFTYITLFKNIHILCQIILGAFSFIFYSPTYLIVLNIYSLCRIDDISWGTKGLDASNTNNRLKLTWSLVKYIHVAKFIIWNIILAFILLTIGASQVARFYITFTVVILIAGTLSIKMIIAVIYLIMYKCNTWCHEPIKQLNIQNLKRKSRIQKIFQDYHHDILDQVKGHLYRLAQKYRNSQFQKDGRTFIQLAKTQTQIERERMKQKIDFFQRSQLSYPPQLSARFSSSYRGDNLQIKGQRVHNLPINTHDNLQNMENSGAKKLSQKQSNSLSKQVSLQYRDRQQIIPQIRIIKPMRSMKDSRFKPQNIIEQKQPN